MNWTACRTLILKTNTRWSAIFMALGMLWSVSTTAHAADTVDFGRDILPILSNNCFLCHGPDAATRKADLRLDVHEEALRKDHPVIVPGKSAASELVQRVTSDNPRDRMPPPGSNRQLTAAQIELLQRWIDQGATWGEHWAYRPPRRPELPKVQDAAWPRNPIDYFILARLEREGLRPSAEAPKETLIRRVTLDLTGLPPTPAEVDAFLNDTSPNAYENVVDRLLVSPRYGERLAWDWLDAARYADSNGYQGDPERTMWPWRDWVVKAFNDNMPYDQFTIEQLAGDLLPPSSQGGEKGGMSQIIATGFNRNHMHNGEGGRIAEETRAENVMDRVETTATVWLGLTMTCARCHDHKFDPFTQRDYYRLYAYFNNTSEDGAGRGGQAAPAIAYATPEEEKQLTALRQQVRQAGVAVAAAEQELFTQVGDAESTNKLPANIRAALKRPPDSRSSKELADLLAHFTKTEPEYGNLLAKLKQAVDRRDGFDAQLPRVMIMDELPKPRDTFILVRGAYDKYGDKVTAGVPASLPPLPAHAPPNRLALARWLVSADNPLTARVTVNRYWQTFFGAGLVKTVEDFGVQGEKPSHPELLDWLALEFSERPAGERHAWDVKRLHRLMVTSATYRQASKVTPAVYERDPDNRLLARGPRYRLPSWMIRDQALAASGLLVEKLGGPPVKPYQPAGIWAEATFGKKTYQQDKGEALYRRSLYTFWRRIVGPPLFFDNAARQVCTVKVVRTNTPLHALTTLNDVTFVEAARALAQRVLETSEAVEEKRLAAAFRFVTARYPTTQEEQILQGCLDKLRAQYTADPDAAVQLLSVGESKRNEQLNPRDHAAYTALCLMILNLDEALTKQ